MKKFKIFVIIFAVILILKNLIALATGYWWAYPASSPANGSVYIAIEFFMLFLIPLLFIIFSSLINQKRTWPYKMISFGSVLIIIFYLLILIIGLIYHDSYNYLYTINIFVIIILLIIVIYSFKQKHITLLENKPVI